MPPEPPADRPIPVIIDTDAKNEVDDQWAIALAILRLDRFDIEGFVGATYGTKGPFQEKVDRSVAEIHHVLKLAGAKGKWPVHAGSVPMSGMEEFSDSPGIDFIVERARAHTPENPLWVVLLGAPTNIVSAWLKAPDIADKVVVFWHGRSQWPGKNQNFNAKGDPFATRTLFESNLPLVLFDTGGHLTCPMPESEKMVSVHGALGKYLHEYRKTNNYFMRDDKGMFDLGDIAALVNPALGKWEAVECPTVTKDLVYDFSRLNGRILRCSDVDRNGTFRLLFDALEKSGGLVRTGSQRHHGHRRSGTSWKLAPREDGSSLDHCISQFHSDSSPLPLPGFADGVQFQNAADGSVVQGNASGIRVIRAMERGRT